MGKCITPFYKRQDDKYTPLPCGKCPECLSRRTSGWSFRLMQEDKISYNAYFITLTYDAKHVPISPNGFLQLQKRDLQLFFKRLRKSHSSLYKKLKLSDSSQRRLKYYAVGEYGTHRKRPHYHIILFNCFAELIHEAWKLPETKQPIGEIYYGTVTEASVGYTLKYMCKPPSIKKHSRDDRQREFSLMSKKLGVSYLTENMIRWHKRDLENRMYCNLTDGKKIAMPRYYKDKIYNTQEEKWRIKAHFSALSNEEVQTMKVKELSEAHMASFNKFYNRAVQGRNKI